LFAVFLLSDIYQTQDHDMPMYKFSVEWYGLQYHVEISWSFRNSDCQHISRDNLSSYES